MLASVFVVVIHAICCLRVRFQSRLLRAAFRGRAAKLNTQVYEKYSGCVGTYARVHLILQQDQDSKEWEKDTDLTPQFGSHSNSPVLSCLCLCRGLTNVAWPRGTEVERWVPEVTRQVIDEAKPGTHGIRQASKIFQVHLQSQSRAVFSWCNSRARICL